MKTNPLFYYVSMTALRGKPILGSELIALGYSEVPAGSEGFPSMREAIAFRDEWLERIEGNDKDKALVPRIASSAPSF